MDNVQQIFLNDIETALIGMSADESMKASLLQKYELLAEAKLGVASGDVISNDSENYSILLNKVLFMSVLGSTNKVTLLDYKNLNKMLTVIENSNGDKGKSQNHNTLYKELCNVAIEHGSNIIGSVSNDDIVNALNTFGLEKADVDDIEIEDDNDEIDDSEFNDLFDAEFTGEEKEFEGEDAELDMEDLDLDDNEDSASDEQKKEIAEVFSAFINQNVKTLANVLSGLYESGFNAIPHAGILVGTKSGSPLVKLKSSIKEGFSVENMTAKSDEGTAFDYMILQSIIKCLPVFSEYADVNSSKNAIPDINELMNNQRVCAALHLQFQSANVDFCTGITSIRKWITETQLKDSGCANADEWIQKVNHGSRRLLAFKKVRNWYEWSLKRIITEALADAGVKSLQDMDLARRVLEALDKNIRNIIVVSDRAIGETEEIKICTFGSINKDDIISQLRNDLNIGSSQGIAISEIAKDNFVNNNILTLSIVFDKDKANNSDRFAFEIIDRLADSGTLPSWGNALLGKKEDGTYLFWQDFMGSAEPFKRNYTIYAGSRSGKGVMTSTLVASAMADSRQVFYTDGKPENGACLGEMAWLEGKEAYIFDGQAQGKRPFAGYMENYSNGVRTPDEVAQFIEKCPRELFENKSYFTAEMQKIFLGVMRYLKSLQLCATVATKRASGDLPSDQWQVWIFDEMTDMSNNEMKVRESFARYMRAKTGAKDLSQEDANYYKIDTSKLKPEMRDPSNEKYDAGLDYICKWVKWTSSIRHLASNMSTISMGKANMNIIFIFQEATWIQEHRKITTIGKVVNQLKSTKIVGRNALANACGEYGDASTVKTDWYAKVNAGNGWWAISKSSDLRASGVTLFKPYKVWTTPLIPGTDDRDPSGFDYDNPDSIRFHEKYVAGYIKNLLGKVGINPADILQSAFDYADQAVQTLGYAGSLKEYIYDCTNFAIDNSDNSYENLHNELNSEDSQMQSGSNGFMDIDDDEDDEAYDKELLDELTKEMKFVTATGLSKKGYSMMQYKAYYEKFLHAKLLKNNFDYADRNVRSNNGLQMAAVVISSLAWISTQCGNEVSREFMQKAFEHINNNDAMTNSAKLGLGMLESYTSGELALDKMPTEDMLRGYMSKYIQMPQNLNNDAPEAFSSAGFSDVDDFGADDAVDDGEEVVVDTNDAGHGYDPFLNYPDDMGPIDRPSWSMSNTGEVRITPRATQQVLQMSNDSFVEAMVPRYTTAERFKKKLFESRTGTSYEFKKRWDYVLKAIENMFPSKTMVARLAITGGQITVNGKVIRVNDILGDNQYGIEISDLIRIKDTMKKFPMIKQLILDAPATQQLINEYGPDAESIWQLFRENRSLQILSLIPAGNSNPINYNRNTFANTTNALNKQLGVEQYKQQVEKICAVKNPRLEKKSVGYRFKMLGDKTVNFVSKHPSVQKMGKASLAAGALIGVGAVVGWPFALLGVLGYNSFKKR